MKLSDTICTPAQAESLKMLGVIQQSNFYFLIEEGKLIIVKADSYEWSDWPGYEDYPKTSLWTSAELGIVLPTGYYTLRLEVAGRDQWFIFDNKGKECLSDQRFEVEAHARAAVLINLLKTNQLKVEDVNKRLTG
jgi:hypothetical protein